MFIDQATIRVSSGSGGDGAVAFRREKYVRHGGPSGGNGGPGGSVILTATEDLQTLLDFQYRREFKAGAGEPGQTKNKTGKSGANIIIRVPCGTVVYDAETNEPQADLVNSGDSWLAAIGGRGGRGNASFATASQRAPTYGEPGGTPVSRTLRLELKLLADVGLIGLPNAGKSTLIAAVSAARPKIADYPFTTLEPNLGVVRFALGEHLVLADIPGLIAGAHLGAGLGHEFLRHIERTRLLLHVLDLTGGPEQRDPLQDWQTIENELERYNADLAKKPRVAVLSKIDLPEARSNCEQISTVLAAQHFSVFAISSVTGEGLPELLTHLRQAVRELPPPPALSIATTKPVERPPFSIMRKNDAMVITSPWLEQLAAKAKPGDAEAAVSLERSLWQWGIYQELRRQGVKDGDTIRIGDFEFVFVE
ncbi:MAG: GTPase ObgE [Cyanobacteria bacterium NC_groundwater_1444_Ag_S-0.65um_54_12]|nr:GTPase ObgE [Cyanobacteria bacterium NC_groundwater_1444_Ag_S-0.65um_54_12]